MPKIELISYNIKGSSKALQAMCSYIANRKYVICAIQELFPKKQSITSPMKQSQKYIGALIAKWTGGNIVIANSISEKVVFLASKDLKVQPISNISTLNRYSVLKMISSKLGEIKVIGIHNYDLRNYPLGDSDRITKEQILSSEINTFADMNPTIIIGDFNCPPYYDMLAGIHGFFARRDKADVVEYSSHKTKLVYYNPCWDLLRESSEHINGTYYTNNMRKIVRWALLDQIIVSHQFVNRISKCKILDSIPSCKFVSNGKIDQQFSDHLPVRAVLDLM